MPRCVLMWTYYNGPPVASSFVVSSTYLLLDLGRWSGHEPIRYEHDAFSHGTLVSSGKHALAWIDLLLIKTALPWTSPRISSVFHPVAPAPCPAYSVDLSAVAFWFEIFIGTSSTLPHRLTLTLPCCLLTLRLILCMVTFGVALCPGGAWSRCTVMAWLRLLSSVQARWTPLVDDNGQERRGPRPLRTTARPWGLDGLTLREMRQLTQGSAFALQVLWCACATLCWGGFFISEHPAAPRDPGRATMWRTPLMQTLLQAVQATLVTISQWRWGSMTPKPTTLLAIRLPFLRASMDKWQVPGLSKPEACAMGLQDGVFRTEEMKTYSEALSAAFAQGIFDGLKRASQHGQLRLCSFPEEVERWVNLLSRLSAEIDPQGHRLPDFQDLYRSRVQTAFLACWLRQFKRRA